MIKKQLVIVLFFFILLSCSNYADLSDNVRIYNIHMDIIPKKNSQNSLKKIYNAFDAKLKYSIFSLPERNGNYKLQIKKNKIILDMNVLYFTDKYKNPQTVINLIRLNEPYYLKSKGNIYRYSFNKIKYAFLGTYQDDVIVNIIFINRKELNVFLKKFELLKCPIIFGYPKDIYGGKRILLKDKELHQSHFKKFGFYNNNKLLLSLQFLGRAKRELVFKILSKNTDSVYIDYYFNFLLSKHYKPIVSNYKINNIKIKKYKPKNEDIQKYLKSIESIMLKRMKQMNDPVILPHEEIYYDKDGNVIQKKTNYTDY